MDLRQIRYVLAVARQGAVRRAAATLNVDQSIVSAKTRDLEAELGVRLFERHSGGVRLTDPGEVFVVGASRALQALEDTASKVRTAGRGQSGALNIGYVWSVAAGPANALLTEQRAQAPAVEITLREQGVSELSASLMERSLDLAFLVGESFPRKFEHQTLWTERLNFVVQEACTLTTETEWSLLEAHPLLVSAWEDWTLYQRMAERSGGPRFDPHVHNCSREGVLGLVAAGRGVAIAPESTSLILFPGIRFLAIADPAAECVVNAAWLKENDNPALKQFVQLLRRRYPDKRRRGG
jgi:DNA-binding transcriptional LysR family regulator